MFYDTTQSLLNDYECFSLYYCPLFGIHSILKASVPDVEFLVSRKNIASQSVCPSVD
jgi:hypothetical protein